MLYTILYPWFFGGVVDVPGATDPLRPGGDVLPGLGEMIAGSLFGLIKTRQNGPHRQ